MNLIWDPSLREYEKKQSLEQDLKDFKAPFPLRLYFDQGALKIENENFKNIHCDFTSPTYLKEVRQNYARSESVFSFLKKGTHLKICDLTVGMGRDFFKFVLAGHTVTGFERNPLIYHLVRDGLERFQQSDTSRELKKIFKRENFLYDLKLGEGPAEESFDLIYYDPMFEDASKKAAPKKNMQVLKKICAVSEEGEKESTIRKALKVSDQVIYKCAQALEGFPFDIRREIKGKGFSYLVL